jgi:cation diffusion facilitator family transporter
MALRRNAARKRIVYAALAGNLAIAVTKFIAAAISGSSAMFSEGVHSLVDTGNELLLLYGMRRSAEPPSPEHPLGHGRELYFWNFVVALLVFALGAGVSIYQGVTHLRHPLPMGPAGVAYVVLAFSFLFEGASWRIAFIEFRRSKGDLGYVEAIRRSKDSTTFTVLLEDSAALVGIVIAFLGMFASRRFGMHEFDGIASILIGVVLGITAIVLAIETKGLLIGEQALPEIRDSVLEIAGADEGIDHANGVITVQMGPNRIVAALSAEFRDGQTTGEIERCVNRIEKRIKAAHPEIATLFVKPQTAATWRKRTAALEDAEHDDVTPA